MSVEQIFLMDLDVHGANESITDRLVAAGALSQNKINGLPAALAGLASDISAEQTRALAAEADLSGSVSSLNTDLQSGLALKFNKAGGSFDANAFVSFNGTLGSASIRDGQLSVQHQVGNDYCTLSHASSFSVDSWLDAEETGTWIEASHDSIVFQATTSNYDSYAQLEIVTDGVKLTEGATGNALMPVADEHVVVKKYVDDADAELAADLSAEQTARIAGDAATLSSAESYTDTKIAQLVNSAPAMLDTLGEIAAALQTEQGATTTILNAIASEQTRAEGAESALDGRLDILEGANTVVGSVAQQVKVETDRAEAAESALDGRLDVLEAKQWRQAVILSAVQGTTSLAKPVGAPAIPNNAAEVMVFIDGRKVFFGSQFTVAAGGGSVTFASLRAQQSVEVLYFA